MRKWFFRKWLDKNLNQVFMDIEDAGSLYVKMNPNKTVREYAAFSERKNRLLDMVMLLKLSLEDDPNRRMGAVQSLLLGNVEQKAEPKKRPLNRAERRSKYGPIKGSRKWKK